MSMCRGAYTNKAPGGVAYRCSFRITEASFLIERLVQNAAYELGIDPADIRFKNFIQPEQFPYETATGFVYDSGDYPTALRKALDAVGYEALRRRAGRAHARRARLIGIGIAHFTEAVGAGPSKTYDIAGLKMIDSAELRVHPTGKAILKLGVKSQGQGHETTFAQIVAQELGIPVTDIKVLEGDTDNTPYGLGTYASRSTPVGGAATAMVSRQLAGEGASKIAAHLLEAAEDDIELENGQLFVRGTPDRAVTIQDVALAAYTNLPDGMEYGLEGVHYYDPPNLTYPYGSYVVVVEVDADTGVWKVQRHGRPRRLRGADQPDDRRGSDPRRADRGLRHVVDAVDHLRRRRQLHRLELHGLPRSRPPGRRRGSSCCNVSAVAAPPDRGQGRGGVGHGRLARGLRQRGRRRARTRGVTSSTCPCSLTGCGVPSTAPGRDRRRARRRAREPRSAAHDGQRFWHRRLRWPPPASRSRSPP